MEKQITIDQVAGILKDPSIHALTKTTIEAAMKRDIVDAYYDVLLAAKCIKAIKDEALRNCGLVKVKGALGGTYWE